MTMGDAALDLRNRIEGSHGNDAERAQDAESILAALGKAQAMIEFNLDGNILGANENFLKTVGYTREELKGRHHSMFCETTLTSSPEYRRFWTALAKGEAQSGLFKRIHKSGKAVYIQASYCAVLDRGGLPCKVVKFAIDVTEETEAKLEQEAKVARIQSMMDNMPINVMMADVSGNILYLNPKSIETLKTIEKDLPIPVSKIVGSSFDVFHKNPAHQRKLVANENNLPHEVMFVRIPDGANLYPLTARDASAN